MRTFEKKARQPTSDTLRRPPVAQNAAASPIQQLQRRVGNQALQRMLQAHAGKAKEDARDAVGIQPKLTVNTPGDVHEQEADRVAGQVMRMEEPSVQSEATADISGRAATPVAQVQTKSTQAGDSGGAAAPPIVHEVLRSPGQPLDGATRAFMEPRFGQDFGHVRVHTDAKAAQANSAIRANAFTVGNHLAFGFGRYAPATQRGKSLIAHELTHTVQQNSGTHHPAGDRVQRDYYTPAERKEMAEGRVVGQKSDLDLATQRHFQPGDLVFRLGSVPLGLLIGEPVTHGGIYVGGGLIHDVAGFGNRLVRTSNFFDPKLGEAADSSTYRLVRFKGPQRDLIVRRLLANIARRDFRLPSDPIPFNLFSSTDDYKTATCLEYAHAQFLHAIRQLSVDQSVPASDRTALRKTYFAGGAAEPKALIKPQEHVLMGNAVEMSGMSSMSGSGGGFGSQPSRTPSAKLQEDVLIGAATLRASDVDPKKFSNRSDSQFVEHWPGGNPAEAGIGGNLVNLLLGMTYDEVVLRTFTYKSFVDSRQFFEDVT
jgi:hypothetical protein